MELRRLRWSRLVFQNFPFVAAECETIRLFSRGKSFAQFADASLTFPFSWIADIRNVCVFPTKSLLWFAATFALRIDSYTRLCYQSRPSARKFRKSLSKVSKCSFENRQADLQRASSGDDNSATRTSFRVPREKCGANDHNSRNYVEILMYARYSHCTNKSPHSPDFPAVEVSHTSAELHNATARSYFPFMNMEN